MLLVDEGAAPLVAFPVALAVTFPLAVAVAFAGREAEAVPLVGADDDLGMVIVATDVPRDVVNTRLGNKMVVVNTVVDKETDCW